MAIFALTYSYTDDTATRDEYRPPHRAYLTGLAEQGVVLAAGPYAETGSPGALLLVRAESAAAVQDLVAGDPLQTAGVISKAEIREWTPVTGALVAAFG